MTKQIDIQELIPYLKEGWVTMDSDGVWYWHEEEPYIEGDFWLNDEQLRNFDCFNIAPVSDWTKSLIQINESQNNLCTTDE